jgi:hypothetical protein
VTERERIDEREQPAEPQAAAEPARGKDRRSGTLGALDPVAAYERRTTRIREEIARNRRGEYRVPTWVLALALAGVVGIWIVVLFVL